MKIKTNVSKLSPADTITLASTVVTKITGNPNFTTPIPALADVTLKKTATITAKNTAEVARASAKAATEDLGNAKKALDQILTQLALYVENTSGGDEAKILSSGFSVRDPKAPIGPLPAPQDLSATAGDVDGTIDLNFEPVHGASSYIIQMSADPPAAWTFKQNSNESRARIAGLTSGTKYWFKVAGMGAAGQGAFSDPACKYAP